MILNSEARVTKLVEVSSRSHSSDWDRFMGFWKFSEILWMFKHAAFGLRKKGDFNRLKIFSDHGKDLKRL